MIMSLNLIDFSVPVESRSTNIARPNSQWARHVIESSASLRLRIRLPFWANERY